MTDRKEQEYRGYIIRPIYKTKWAVYRPGAPNWKVGGGRCGTVHPDEKMSANLGSVDECKAVIDGFGDFRW